MPLDKSDYKIDIKTTADTAPVKQSKEAFQELTGAVKKSGDASTASAKDVDKLELSHRQLHSVLERVAPGLAEIAHFMTSGLAGAIGIVLVAFSYLNEKLEEFKKLLQDIDSGPGARGEWAEKIRDNTREAAVEMAAFNEQLHAAAVAQETLDKITDRVIAHQKDQASAAKELGDAQKELDLARLALREKLGELSPDEAVKIRLEIDDAAFKRQLAAEKAAIEAELSARQQELSGNEYREPALNAAMTNAGAAALAAKNAQDKNAAKLDQDKTNLAALPDKIKAAEAAMEDRRHGIAGITVPDSELARDPEYQVAQKQLTQLYNLQASYQRSMRQEQGKQQPLEEAASLSKQQFERAKADYAAAAKISEETTHTIADLQAKLAGATAKDNALQNIHSQTSAATAAGQNVDIAKRVAAGQGTPSEIAQVADWQSQARFAQTGAGDLSTVASNARAAMSDARSAVQSGRGNDGQLHGLMNEFIGLAQDIHASAAQRHEFQDLERQVETLRRQIAVNRTSP